MRKKFVHTDRLALCGAYEMHEFLLMISQLGGKYNGGWKNLADFERGG